MLLGFGEFTLDLGRFELRRGDELVRLEPKVFDVLQYLVTHRSRVVPRDELLATLWPDEHVVDAVVTRCIYEIRRALVRPGSELDPIETLRARGYRFTQPVRRLDVEPESIETKEPFVGRERELQRIEAALARAQRGEGRFVLLAGEPGVGKTRLTEEVAARMRAGGNVVWTCRCHEAPGAPPFWLWTQIVRRCLRELDEAEVRRELGASFIELAALVPEVVGTRSTDESSEPVHADAAHYRLFDATTRLLRLATARRLHLLVLNDLHWADRPSLQLLGFVVAQLGDRPLLVLGTCRDTDWRADDRRKGTIEGFARHATFERIMVPALAREAVDDYVTRCLGRPRPEAAEALFRLCEGNAFFMVEALRPLRADPLSREPEAAIALPEESRDIVRSRLTWLDEETRSVLETAAMFGVEFEVGLVADVVGSDAVRVLELLQPVLHARLIVSTPEAGGRFRFAHGSIRETLASGIQLARQAALHASVAQRLERLPSPPLGELAHHHHRSLPSGDAAKALRWARAAGEAASRLYAHDAAAVHYRQALDALRLLPDADVNAQQELLRALGGALHLAGRLDDAMSTFRDAAALARSLGDTRSLALAVIGLRDCQPLRAVPDPTVDAELRDALDRLPAEAVDLRARILARMAAVRGVDTRRKASGLAAELARDVQDPHVLADVWSARLHALQGPDEIDLRLEVADRLVALADEHRHSAWAWEALIARHDSALRRGDVDAYDRALGDCAALADRLRHPRMHLERARLEAQRAIGEGRYADAEREILRHAETSQRLSDPGGEFYFLLQTLWLLRDRGAAGQVVHLVEPFIRARPWVEPTARATAALIEVEAKAVDAARRSLAYCARNDFEVIPYGESYVSVFSQLASVCVALGAAEHYERLYAVLAPYAGLFAASGSSVCLGSVEYFLGLLAGAMGRVDVARGHFERALARNEPMRMRPAIARTEFAYAALLARDHPGEAADHRARATEIAARIGLAL